MLSGCFEPMTEQHPVSQQVVVSSMALEQHSAPFFSLEQHASDFTSSEAINSANHLKKSKDLILTCFVFRHINIDVQIAFCIDNGNILYRSINVLSYTD
jgi:hypothetical protein